MISKPDIALREATTDQIIDRLVLDMLQSFYGSGKNPDLDEKIEAAWLKLRGVPFLARSVTPTYLRGFPGAGQNHKLPGCSAASGPNDRSRVYIKPCR